MQWTAKTRAGRMTERFRPVRRYGIRGYVINKWEREGKPPWNLRRTVAACKETDAFYRSGDLNPAPVFREAIEARDEMHITVWMYGCRFPWLEAREE